MSSEPSSPASPPPPSSPQEEMGGRRRAAAAAARGIGNGGRNNGDDAGSSEPREQASPAPSTSHRRVRRLANAVWPAPFLESLAIKVAVDASRSFGRTAAASALFNLFQVCSTWRTISRSDMLWHSLTKRIWKRDHRLNENWSWHDEYIYRHRTARNFLTGRYNYRALPIPPPESNNMQRPTCLRLALSDVYIAAGFSNGVVQLFLVSTGELITNIHPNVRDRLGLFPTAVSGIILYATHLVIASLDGDITVVLLDAFTTARLAHPGDIVRDGALVDFSGRRQWWVGLYAGAPGRAFHVWDSESEEELFVGGTLTDQDSLLGWRLLNNLSHANAVGRVRVAADSRAVACTTSRVISFDLLEVGYEFPDLEETSLDRRVLVRCFDSSEELVMLLDGSEWAGLMDAQTLEGNFLFRFRFGQEQHEGGDEFTGCMTDAGYAFLCEAAGGAWLRIWNAENGTYLYRFNERRIGRVDAIVANDRYLVIHSPGRLHIWDFGQR